MKYTKITEKPVEKYPVNYKCTHIYDIADRLKEKYGLDIHNLQPNVPTRNEYHDFNLHDFISKKIQKENTVFPKMRLKDLPTEPGYFDSRMDDYTDTGSVVLLPMHYDSSHDEEIHQKQYKESKAKLIEMFKQLFTGDKLEKSIADIDKHVDFGRSNFEWSNIALTKIYEEYKEYYTNGYLRVWMPFDWDSNADFDSGDNTTHGYPMSKMFVLSEIEEFLSSNYGLSDNLFYQYVVHNNYVEGRYWEKNLRLHFDGVKFIREGGKYGMDATPNIDKMLSVLEMEFKDILLENKNGCFEIYVDYYKKIKEKF